LKEELKSAFDRYYGELCSLAMYYTEDKQEAENLVQQVFVNVWEKKDELLNQKKDLRYYLFTSVKNRGINAASRKRFENLAEDQFVAAGSLSNDFELKDLQEKIQLLIDTMPVKRRVVFTKSRVEGKTYHEISEELGISVKTVENHMSSALKYLRSKIFHSDNQ